MPVEVSIDEAEADLEALVARAERGEQFTLTRDGFRVAILGPVPPLPDDPFRDFYLVPEA
jgi:antitoxin (DNA-binding transcriptional repressor) of toxin-antitoxin stability system